GPPYTVRYGGGWNLTSNASWLGGKHYKLILIARRSRHYVVTRFDDKTITYFDASFLVEITSIHHEALLKIKSLITHDPYGALTTWNDSLHVCNWSHVYCGKRHRRVTFIELTSQGLEGSLSPHVGNLSFLRTLSLGNNSFQGAIPQELGRLSRLHHLNLYYNRFNEVIPTNISGCVNLEKISISNNELVGSIPKEISSLNKLTFLSLFNNKLTGGIPPILGNITSLGLFSVRGNPLGGTIPDTLGHLKNLIGFYLGSCNLNGTIPNSLYNLSLLDYISLADNQLTGGLHSAIDFPHLVVLRLWGNQLSGPLPASISNCTRLGILELADNKFSGHMSIDFSKLTDINIIKIGDNLFGSKEADDMKFIDYLKNCMKLEVLSLGRNQFTGNIPSTIGNLQSLKELYLYGNQLSGHIPDSMGNLSSLITLSLYSNMLEGVIPLSLGNCHHLLVLALNDNKLNGKIPIQLLQLSSLSIILDLSQNNLFGSLPSEVGNLNMLTALDLSYNNLSGNIPTSLGGCSSLLQLSLKGNLFQGVIPLSLGSLKGLIELDISHNNLSGQIPTFLDQFKLEYLNMSYNDFEGEVPMKRKSHLSQTSTWERYLKVSYNQLLKATNGFSESNLIGTGGYSSVYKGILNEADDSFVAIKVLHLQNRGAQRSFMRECEAWRNIRHRNLLKVITSCSSVDFQGNPFKALVYEFMPNGSLHDWLHSSKNTARLNLLQLIKILTDVAYALDYIHNHCLPAIIHCDLKPSNILLDNDMVAHVGDFGLARFLGTSYPNNSTRIQGTMGYVPPEYGLGSEMASSGDVYSFGILVLEVMTGKSPTDNIFNEDLCLHKFASMALLDNVIDIIDVNIINLYKENNIVLQNMEAAKKTEECLALWKHLRQIIQAENYHNYPPQEPNYVNIESPPSMQPQKQICAITGFEPIYSMRTQKFLSSSAVFLMIFNTFIIYKGGKMGVLIITEPVCKPDEEQLIAYSAKNPYEQFRSKVAYSGSTSVDKMEEITQGRVWSGNYAVSQGLVDAIGGFPWAVL
ncbi:hypothetical protein M8C21_029960, partial [Ambrosia artemisiifolia]